LRGGRRRDQVEHPHGRSLVPSSVLRR
jgi:hypothetical protein